MKKLVILALAMILMGCANQQQVAALHNQYLATIPTCSDGKDCERQWAAARRWVISNARMKIQHYSDDFIETYNSPANSPALAVRVMKEPIEDDRYRITIDTYCNNIFGCQPNQHQAALHFNQTVNAAAVNERAPLTTTSAAP